MSGHVVPASTYWKTFVWLMILMILTVVAAQVNLEHYIPIRGLNVTVALLIAITKATLVVLFFMGVKYGTKLTWLWAALGFIWLFLLSGIALDYVARGWVDTGGWERY
jgi:cytochrome c oxidase subunit 4